jgi:hypothetical protein
VIEPEPANVAPLRGRIDQLLAEARSGEPGAADAFGRHMASVVRQVGGLWRNIARSVQVLEDRLTDEERGQILAAVARGKGAPAAALNELEDALRDLEQAAGIIGEAMLRNQPR